MPFSTLHTKPRGMVPLGEKNPMPLSLTLHRKSQGLGPLDREDTQGHPITRNKKR